VGEKTTEEVTKKLEWLGIKINSGAKVTRIEGSKLSCEKDGKEEICEADKILILVGLVPNTERLNIKAVG